MIDLDRIKPQSNISNLISNNLKFHDRIMIKNPYHLLIPNLKIDCFFVIKTIVHIDTIKTIGASPVNSGTMLAPVTAIDFALCGISLIDRMMISSSNS